MGWTLSFAAWLQSSGDCDGGRGSGSAALGGPTVVERGKEERIKRKARGDQRVDVRVTGI
jgi:hypothetical protein